MFAALVVAIGLSFFIAGVTATSDLNKCCTIGRHAFNTGHTCTRIHIAKSKLQRHAIAAAYNSSSHRFTHANCKRTADICCLRQQIDYSCKEGKTFAQRSSSCPALAERGEAIYKECCDCCLIAEEMFAATGHCEALWHFGHLCNRTFYACCHAKSTVLSGSTNGGWVGSSLTNQHPHRHHHHAQSHRDNVDADAGDRDHESRRQHSADEQISNVVATRENEAGSILINTYNAYVDATAEPPLADDNSVESTKSSSAPSVEIVRINRCLSANPCKQLCEDHGGAEVACACTVGYKLALDGYHCEDIDECLDNSSRCDLETEICLNKLGTFECAPSSETAAPVVRVVLAEGESDNSIGQSQLAPGGGGNSSRNATERTSEYNVCGLGFRDVNGFCFDVDECDHSSLVSQPADVSSDFVTFTAACDLTNQFCVNTIGSYECKCQDGYALSLLSHSCEDVDECLLLTDNCLDTQRCLNTPGSYKCIRTLSCGTGYYLDSRTEECVDVDECALGTHDCTRGYSCRNTAGSFRCEYRVCMHGTTLNAQTGECAKVHCPQGMRADNRGNCEDVNECLIPGACEQSQQCTNTVGSYQCSAPHNYCGDGYKADPVTGHCVDVNECESGAHSCSANDSCVNLPGSFRCECPNGYSFNAANKTCADIDECKRFGGHVCSHHATCENVPGSFRCHCNKGFVLKEDGRTCEDIDECESGQANCAQRCINIPGSYECICERGYTLSTINNTCIDINECTAWGQSGSNLCAGRCVNLPGSYRCECPTGYELNRDGRTCQDIDECAEGYCQGHRKLCLNLLGGYKCINIDCPRNYVYDPHIKNRCNRKATTCAQADSVCRDLPMFVAYQEIAIPKRLKLSSFGVPAVQLFTMPGPKLASTSINFELELVRVVNLSIAGVRPATRNSFLLQKGASHNSVVVLLGESLEGPQQVHLELLMRYQHSNGHFEGHAKANLIVHVLSIEQARTTRFDPKPVFVHTNNQHLYVLK